MPVLAKPDDACVTAQRCVKNSHHLKSLGKFWFVLPNYYQKLWQAQSMIVLTLGRKVSDEFTVPLCRTHHREIHRCGDEEAWWRNSGTDPLAAARTLWLGTHPLARMEATAANNEATFHGTYLAPKR